MNGRDVRVPYSYHQPRLCLTVGEAEEHPRLVPGRIYNTSPPCRLKVTKFLYRTAGLDRSGLRSKDLAKYKFPVFVKKSNLAARYWPSPRRVAWKPMRMVLSGR